MSRIARSCTRSVRYLASTRPRDRAHRSGSSRRPEPRRFLRSSNDLNGQAINTTANEAWISSCQNLIGDLPLCSGVISTLARIDDDLAIVFVILVATVEHD
jgi:hypothetical protein